MRHFKEYLDNKGQLQNKPIIDPLADTTPPTPKNPQEFATQGKDWKDKAAVKTAQEPFSAPDMGKTSEKKALGDEGDNNLIYKPNTKPKVKEILGSFPNEASLSQLGSFLQLHETSLPGVYALKEGKNYPDPMQTIQYLTNLANVNNKVMEGLVLEFKRKGLFEQLIAQLTRYQESIPVLARHINASQWKKALAELTAPPAVEEDETLDEPVSKEDDLQTDVPPDAEESLKKDNRLPDKYMAGSGLHPSKLRRAKSIAGEPIEPAPNIGQSSSGINF